MTSSSASSTPLFPAHTGPKVWFITSASSPIGLAVAKELLKHGDLIVAGDCPNSVGVDETEREALWPLQSYAESHDWLERLRIVKVDLR